MLRQSVPILLGATVLSACASGSSLGGANVATGSAAYQVLSSPQAQAAPVVPVGEYRIAPFDALAVSVFQEPELSTPADSPVLVDARGNISLPLVGSVTAAGRTSEEVASRIAGQLKGRYLKNPLVTVSVASSAPQKITVQGEVTQPGMFDVKGRASLLEAIALARGETRLASTEEVAVFRNVNGQRMGALFNVDAIRRGAAPDPELLPNDIVIVGHSRGRQIWQDILSVTPLFGVFRTISVL